MKIGIVGSRRYTNKNIIKHTLIKAKEKFGNDLVIVSGGCPKGADRIGKECALELNIVYEEYPPEFRDCNEYCPCNPKEYNKPYNIGLYFKRNTQIAENSDIVIGFIPEGITSNGTMDTLNKAKKLGKKITIIN